MRVVWWRVSSEVYVDERGCGGKGEGTRPRGKGERGAGEEGEEKAAARGAREDRDSNKIYYRRKMMAPRETKRRGPMWH